MQSRLDSGPGARAQAVGHMKVRSNRSRCQDEVVIDLRSDTVTRPSAGMRKAIAEAEVGDDVWGDDPTVRLLEAKVADLLGKEAALFVTSGTQGNLCAILAHCGRGDSFVVGLGAHSFRYEAGGAAVLGSVQPHALALQSNGQFDLDQVAESIPPDDPHFAPIRLLCIENTHDGMPLPLSYHKHVADVADQFGLGLHLDGARLWNAAAALGVPLDELGEPFDTVSVCLSKGLGAPVGSVLAGSQNLIDRAFRVRKMLGGALRQTGVVAAAGVYAIDNNRERLIDDHSNAARLAEGLSSIPGVEVAAQNTNMVFVDFGPAADGIDAAAAEHEILVSLHDGQARLVTHLDVSANDIETALDVMKAAV